jgi:antitoxin (DNA-binding transcriptional repressor) of toxin-antitoxin stability system
MKKTISVTEAARNFADCVNRTHYQNVTFILLKNGSPVARLVPDGGKVCTGSDLASAFAEARLPAEELREWGRDLRDARRQLKKVSGKWE